MAASRMGLRPAGPTDSPAVSPLLAKEGVRGRSPKVAPTPAHRADLENAERRAIAFFASPAVVPDPGWLSLFGYLHRRFGLVARDAHGTPLHELRATVARPEVYAIYRRIDDPSATIDKRQIAALPTAIDRITASALHCDRIPLPDDWVQVLRNATRAGAYALTHAVLATQWSVENGCVARAQVENLHREQEIRLVDLVERRDEIGTRLAAATDIWIEAIAMLYYSGSGARVRGEWVDAMMALQRADGGWPRGPAATRSDPHATALALWVLLENLDPGPPVAWIRHS